MNLFDIHKYTRYVLVLQEQRSGTILQSIRVLVEKIKSVQSALEDINHANFHNPN